MMTAVSVLLLFAAVWLLVPALVLALQCTLAALPQRFSSKSAAGPRPSVAVLVPAHDEELLIEKTVRHLLLRMAATDRLVVVADNCVDGTAALARAAGAEVVERTDLARRGKGYALEFGVRYLARDPPEVVVIVDADCVAHEGCLDRVARAAADSGRPVQARNLQLASAGAGPLDSLSAFAFLVRNVVRPSGLARAGLPCPLTGTGMAFPWSTIAAAPLGTHALTEDLQLGSDLALGGHLPMFCFDALVTSSPPRPRRARETQRHRWEYGHLATLVSRGPRLLVAALRRHHFGLLALALDLCVPPLSMLLLAWTGAIAAAIAAAALLGASWLPAGLLALTGVLLAFAVGEAWFFFGRPDYPFSTLLLAPFYALGKLPMYLGFLARRHRTWVRTGRDPGPRPR